MPGEPGVCCVVLRVCGVLRMGACGCCLPQQATLPLRSGAERAWPWPTLLPCSSAGYIQPSATSVCTPCAAGTYRSGDAAPENNVCKPIPAGYKANANSAANTITPCANGTVSYWSDGTTRVPDKATKSTDCQPCALNTYAPREGMANCLPCKGGSVPAKSSAGLPGPDTCVECDQNKFRSFYTAE